MTYGDLNMIFQIFETCHVITEDITLRTVCKPVFTDGLRVALTVNQSAESSDVISSASLTGLPQSDMQIKNDCNSFVFCFARDHSALE